jgi:hypothetical protein
MTYSLNYGRIRCFVFQACFPSKKTICTPIHTVYIFLGVCVLYLNPNGNYMSHLHQQSVTLHFVFLGFV